MPSLFVLLTILAGCGGGADSQDAAIAFQANPDGPAKSAATARLAPGETPPPKMDHSAFFSGPFEDATQVTQTCLGCHSDAAKEVMTDAHYTWTGNQAKVAGSDETVPLGKVNAINNFCIGTASNMPLCSKCHAGYGWDKGAAPSAEANHVDCLVCHADPTLYKKGFGGWPADGVDLAKAAGSVGSPTRGNCGSCHFKGGGGDGVKHGDLDSSLTNPAETVDVHMGRANFECQTCHLVHKHQIPGCSLGVCTDRDERIGCAGCHSEKPHADEILNRHSASVACQSCHIPAMAVGGVPTKMWWDWSTAGQNRPDKPHEYAKKKGSSRYEENATPQYRWYNAKTHTVRYLKGDKITPGEVVQLNDVCGDPRDPDTRLWPVKVNGGKQAYDKVNGYLLIPKTVGKDGYWKTFNWDRSFRLAAAESGLEYSGSYGWVETEMVWPLSHMVQPKDKALGCMDCHGDSGRIDWKALGYDQDPSISGRSDPDTPVRQTLAEGQGLRPHCAATKK